MAKQDNLILAVDVGGGGLKMAEFSVSPEGIIGLESFAVKEFPDRETDPVVAFAEVYRQMLNENRFRAKAVSLCISGAASFSRLSPLPSLSGNHANIAKVIEFEAGTVVPYDMSEVCWGYQLLKHTVQVKHEIESVVGEDQTTSRIEIEDKDEFEALFVAVKTDQIAAYTDVIVNSGKQIRSVDIAPVAMFNAAKATQCEGGESTLLLNIGARCTSLVIAEGERIFVRSIPIAGDTITQQISKEFGVSFQEAEDMKIRHGFIALGGAYDEPKSELEASISKIARSVMTRLHGEINRSFSVWRSAHGGTAPKRMLLAGGGSVMQYTQEFFQEKLHIEVSYLNVFSGLDLQHVDREKLLDVAPMFSELIGMSLRQVGVCPVDISLVPESITFQQEFLKKHLYFYASMVLILFCLVCFLGVIYYRTGIGAQMLEGTKGGVEKTLQMQKNIRKLNSDFETARGDYEEAMRFVRSRSAWTDMLQELQSIVPNTMFLVAIEGLGTEIAPEKGSADTAAESGGLFGSSGNRAGEKNAPKSGFVRKRAELVTEVKEVRLRFYTLTLPKEDLIEDLFKSKLRDSKFFEPEGRIVAYENGDVNDCLKSFTLVLTLKEPIKK